MRELDKFGNWANAGTRQYGNWASAGTRKVRELGKCGNWASAETGKVPKIYLKTYILIAFSHYIGRTVGVHNTELYVHIDERHIVLTATMYIRGQLKK